eukprot:15599807-Heterocapsa_arctica.AAC.1
MRSLDAFTVVLHPDHDDVVLALSTEVEAIVSCSERAKVDIPLQPVQDGLVVHDDEQVHVHAQDVIDSAICCSMDRASSLEVK